MSAVISAVIAGISTIVSAFILAKVRQVHELVNSRMDAALEEIKDLKSERQIVRDAQAGGEQQK